MKIHSAADQRSRILNHLKRHGSATTIELRHELDVLQPAARVFELRHKYSHNIITAWDNAKNPNGGTHRVARYTLLTEDSMEVNL